MTRPTAAARWADEALAHDPTACTCETCGHTVEWTTDGQCDDCLDARERDVEETEAMADLSADAGWQAAQIAARDAWMEALDAAGPDDCLRPGPARATPTNTYDSRGAAL